jgi:hypothetical protein
MDKIHDLFKFSVGQVLNLSGQRKANVFQFVLLIGLRFGGAFFIVFTAQKAVDGDSEKVSQPLHRVKVRLPFAALPVADGGLGDPESFCEGVLGISCVFS